jgi:hypothetical protein
MRVAVLAVPPSVAAGTGGDRTGPVLATLAQQADGEIVARGLVSGGAPAIETWLRTKLAPERR